MKSNSLYYQVPVDVFKGITDEDAAKVVDGLAPKTADRQSSIEQIKKLYELFCKTDCTMLEVLQCEVFLICDVKYLCHSYDLDFLCE